ncbi:biotin--[acetyl-CoA-carboxylase] ligase [Ideonella sp.]|uniref:biotin--[acetyl-CoA-carboxylase] ligase n=1 Tax=Ideonella sp. TaxID=1929293 RepID=UPI002B495DAA|nr:biotin--[acetyl-CoA-carboxylase] ligase [Ideonella sp.]HJV72224.1 biotin--[acetyl-CoA-carboxylase] ligase [Ideonella sp.]
MQAGAHPFVDRHAGAEHGGHHGTWGTQALWEQLSPILPGLSIEVVDRLPSTNAALVDRLREASRGARDSHGRGLRADDLRPTLLVAIDQTHGRGRLGRNWQSSAGASLTFSLSLALERADWSGLSLAVGVALAEALDPSGLRIGLKWPNDLWLRQPGEGTGRKLGGILIEAIGLGDHRIAVIGIGLNVQPVHLAEMAASLSEIEPQLTPPAALTRLMPSLASALARFEREGFAGFEAAYAQRDLLLGGQVVTTDAACPRGEAIGVDADGALRVRDPAGTVHRILSGEVSVRPAPAAEPRG